MRSVLSSILLSCLVLAPASAAPSFDHATRAVSTWRTQAIDTLVLSPDEADTLADAGTPSTVARCVKLNNYWCIKAAGWEGEIAADDEGHVAFASAEAGAAVAALLLKRYYVDFGRRTALAIISHWAPSQCGFALGAPPHRTLPPGLGETLRARWLATHARGFVTRIGKGPPVRRSVVDDPIKRSFPAPTIAIGLGEAIRPTTLDALLRADPNAPPSRSMLGLPGAGRHRATGRIAGCGADASRVAIYAGKAADGIAPAPDGDLGLFSADGAPTPNLARMMENMARVEIGPLAAKPSLIQAGIAAAFAPGRHPARP